MATIDELFFLNIGLWWRYGISRHCDEWKYIIIGRIFESEIILIPPSLKISKSSSNGSYLNTDEVWWRYGISRSCDEWTLLETANSVKHCFKVADRQRMTKRNRNIKNTLLCIKWVPILWRIRSRHQYKTILKKCCMKIWHLRFLP